MNDKPRRAMPSADQIKQLNDLADRLEFWGKTNKHDATLLKPWRKKRAMLRTLGIEQTNTATAIRQILSGDLPI